MSVFTKVSPSSSRGGGSGSLGEERGGIKRGIVMRCHMEMTCMQLICIYNLKILKILSITQGKTVLSKLLGVGAHISAFR